jgi:hypothetical protein
MRRALVWPLSLGAALAAAALVGVAWNQQADELCREDAPRTATGYSVEWEWDEFAYVCSYRTPEPRSSRIGIIDAFHGDDKRRHGR